jgi:signal transduction histidine kinase/CheY-like chemotaxis protein
LSIDQTPDAPKYGLKWRLLLVLSLVLLIVNGGFSFLAYQKTSKQYASEQAQRQLTQARELDVLLEQGVEAMAAFASFIPRLSALANVDATAGYVERIDRVLREHGIMLDVEWGLEGVHFFDSANPERPLVSWPEGRSTPPSADLISMVRALETPTADIHCGYPCVQLVVLPLLEDGVTQGFLLLERSLADSLRAFHLASGADLALLAPAGEGRDMAIPAWGVSLPAVTHAHTMLPILEDLALQTGLDALRSDARRLKHGSDWYEVAVLPDFSATSRVSALAINKVTRQVEGIRAALSESIMLGITGLLLSELVLLLLLLGPVHRIQDVVDVLPLFKEKAFQVLRDALPALPAQRFLRDETVVLVEVLGEVSRQMEDLENAHAKARDALRESERSMRLAQSMARVAVWKGVPLGGAFAVTEGADRIHPALQDVDSWQGLMDLVHPDDRGALQLAWRRGRGGGRMDVEFRLRVDGRVIDVHAMAEFEVTGRERTLRAAGMMQDVSDMRRAEREVQAHRARLEEEVMARTAELVEARNEAQKLARSKGDFLATMSHEIRTPLNAVLGLSQVGLQESRNRGIEKTFKQILDAGDHLLNVVNDVLEHSKLEAGKIQIEVRPFELRKVVARCVDMLDARVVAKGLTMPVDFEDGLPRWVEGDAFRLQQILINLLGNAVKFTDRGVVSLSVRQHGGLVGFCVVDTGVGMSREQIAQLFTPFQQLATSSEHRLEGTGLGLSISNTLAMMMGGNIGVRSRPGQGSEFELVLPLPSVTEPADTDGSIAQPVSDSQRLSGLRVLVVDDVAINRTVLEGLLEAEAAQPAFAADGQAAVEMLKESPDGYDAVLMDVHMPGMDGRAATRALRGMNLGLPVIGVSAHASAEERQRSLSSGMDEQLTKPILRGELVDTLLRCLDSGSRAAAANGGRQAAEASQHPGIEATGSRSSRPGIGETGSLRPY